MSCYRRVLPAALRMAAILWIAACSHKAFAAPTNASGAAGIEDYWARLALAQAGQASIQQSVECLAVREAELVSQRDIHQLKLGELRGAERKLQADIATGQSAYEAFDQEHRSQEDRLNDLRQKLRAQQTVKAAQEEELRQCKGKWFAPDWACESAYSVAHWVGLFSNYDEAIKTAQRQVDSARQGRDEVRLRRDESRNQLQKAETESAAVQADIHRTESEIGTLQGDLSNLRSSMHANSTVLDEFKSVLSQAGRIDAQDMRATVARKIHDIEMRIDETTQQLTDAVSHARSMLPAGSAACFKR